MNTPTLNLQKIHPNHTTHSSLLLLLSSTSQFLLCSLISLCTISILLPNTPQHLSILQALGSTIPLSILCLLPALLYSPTRTKTPSLILPLLSLFPLSLPILLPSNPLPLPPPSTLTTLTTLSLSCLLTYICLFSSFKIQLHALSKLHLLTLPPSPDQLSSLETALSALKHHNPTLFNHYTDQLLLILKTREPSRTEIHLLIQHISTFPPAH